jgi:hypothetical protein
MYDRTHSFPFGNLRVVDEGHLEPALQVVSRLEVALGHADAGHVPGPLLEFRDGVQYPALAEDGPVVLFAGADVQLDFVGG